MRYVEQPNGLIFREYTEDELDRAGHAYKEYARAMLEMNDLMILALNQLEVRQPTWTQTNAVRLRMSLAVDRAKTEGLRLGNIFWPDE